MNVEYGYFVWDDKKEAENILKHDIDFETAARVFLDVDRKIFKDSKHSKSEIRMFCLGRVGDKIMTVRYVSRDQKIRIIGAGYWRFGRKHYHG